MNTVYCGVWRHVTPWDRVRLDKTAAGLCGFEVMTRRTCGNSVEDCSDLSVPDNTIKCSMTYLAEMAVLKTNKHWFSTFMGKVRLVIRGYLWHTKTCPTFGHFLTWGNSGFFVTQMLKMLVHCRLFEVIYDMFKVFSLARLNDYIWTFSYIWFSILCFINNQMRYSIGVCVY